jgi:hypothetical protein
LVSRSMSAGEESSTKSRRSLRAPRRPGRGRVGEVARASPLHGPK